MDGVEGMGDSAEMFVGRRGISRAQPDRRRPDQRGAGGAGSDGPAPPGAGPQEFFLETLAEFPGVRRAGRRAAAWRASVLATGPFAAWSGRVVADGAALVGDAADFFDPFTGEGIYSALRGAELLAEAAEARAGPGRAG